LDALARRTARATMAVALLLMGPTTAGLAEEKLPAGADIEAGRAIATTQCAGCHGREGLSATPGVPDLAGQYEGYIATSLAAYKDGRRSDESMVEAAAPLSDAEIANLAAYYTQLAPFKSAPADPGTEAEMPAESETPFAAVREATAECAACHGEDGNAQIPGSPSLAGQPAPYLIIAMQAYQEGARPDDLMQALAAGLSPAEIEDMAFFYAAMVPKRTDTLGAGDPFAGLATTASCVGCHGEHGNSTDPKVPRLAGLDAEYLAAAARAYKDGSRSHAAMQEAMATFRETEIDDMASFYASKDPKALPVRKPLTTQQWVEKCGRCHGQDGNSTDPRFPILTGQDEAYLAKALKLYHGGGRDSQFMYAMSFLMTESDIEKLAAYYARQRTEK
jgi:cytochrome c553